MANEVSTNEVSKKSCCWSVTINNPTADDFQQWSVLSGLHWVRSVTGQVEKGENGTPHIQGMVNTLSVRFSQVKKALPRAHIEAARSPTALAQYVVKEDTRVSSLPTVKVASQREVQEALLDEVLYYGHIRYEWNGCLFLEFLEEYPGRFLADWEYWVDRAVNRLVREGYYGVEFVMANPQVRTAFRKYFVSIMYRTYNERQARIHQASPSPPAPIQEEGSPELS